MLKKLLNGSLVFVLLLATLLCVAAPSRSEAKLVEFTITNKTDKKVYMVFGREGYDDDTTTKGWFNVEPYQTKTFKPFEFDSDDYYFWYAQSGKVVWKGDVFEGWIDPTNAFKSENGRRIPGGKVVGFRRLNVSNSGKAKLSLTIKKKK
jgi:uncharacterized membrane protein